MRSKPASRAARTWSTCSRKRSTIDTPGGCCFETIRPKFMTSSLSELSEKERGSPLEGVGHPALVPARVAQVVKERARHLRVRREAVLVHAAHARVHLVRRVARLEVALAGHRLGPVSYTHL